MTLRIFVLEKVKVLVVKSCLTLCDPMDCSPPGSSVHGIFPGKNTGVHCHSLLQGLNLHLLHCRQILYHLSHRGRWCPREALGNYFDFNEFLQDPDSSGIQGPLGPRMYRMGDGEGRFQTQVMTTEGNILHALVNKGEQDLRSRSWSHPQTLGKLGRG